MPVKKEIEPIGKNKVQLKIAEIKRLINLANLQSLQSALERLNDLEKTYFTKELKPEKQIIDLRKEIRFILLGVSLRAWLKSFL